MSAIAKLDQLYSGKAKTIYKTSTPDLFIVKFRDDLTAFDAIKKDSLAQKGALNNQISAYLMQQLNNADVTTHFVEQLSETTSLIKALKMIPLEIVVRNYAAGSLCRRFGLDSGLKLARPLLELFLKNDELHDPLINDEHALLFGHTNSSQLIQLKSISLKINHILQSLFERAGLILVDCKFEFGIDRQGILTLGDEISPDTCRIWDATTHQPLDKDRFRQDLGKVIESYQQIANRLTDN